MGESLLLLTAYIFCNVVIPSYNYKTFIKKKNIKQQGNTKGTRKNGMNL